MKLFADACTMAARFVIVVSLLATAAFAQGARVPPETNKVTLFAVNRYHSESQSCLKFAPVSRGCHLRYGSLYAGDDWDWFDTASARENRTVVRDLGYLDWSDDFNVPVVAPFPKLLPGQQRSVTVDVSGADGADGLPGLPGRDGADANGATLVKHANEAAVVPQPVSSRPKRDGKPKIDPVFAKAILNHMYVVHVVDEVNDFYVLMRVEAVQRGDSCTVSWKVVPNPEAKLASR